MIHILLADDHTLVREVIKQLLKPTVDMQIVAEAGDGNEVLSQVNGASFDLLILDMSMPGPSGIELIEMVRRAKPQLRMLVLTMYDDEQYAIRAIRAGASGYVTKDSAPAQLVSAIRKVASGGAFISPEIAEQLALHPASASHNLPHTRLSEREYEVFLLVASGTSVTAIAERLNLSVKTVSTHKARLMQKMGLSNQAELIRYAMTHQLIGVAAASDSH